MALDEALLESAPQRNSPLLRFYAWTEPAATFGYFQKFREVKGMTTLRPLIRRPTGGGLVPHEADWTYSLIFPPAHGWYELKATESYIKLHQWIQSAFKRNGLGTELAPRPDRESVGQCFMGAEQFDVLWEKRKIAGAAQRRTRQGLLIQGSVQPPLRAWAHSQDLGKILPAEAGVPVGTPALAGSTLQNQLPTSRECVVQESRADWETTLCEIACDQWGVKWLEMEVEAELELRMLKLAAEKYGTRAFNERR